ncbi:MAG: cob(I)yrinic acid a,c-diamide adenosyltransferase [Firmicutes bacterium]|nr:cob(I)yrinic acid a,c-diamide adenosyltransferase [Bacillota bacterium]
MERGLVHIYYGDGKGKTTAAMGLAARCGGRGGKVLIFQFMKKDESGEREALENISTIDIMSGYEKIKFTSKMSEEEKREAADFYGGKFEEICEKADKYDMIILDEILHAVNKGFVNKERIKEFIKNKPVGVEIVMTGREIDDEFIKLGDYVTEMKKIKHPYDKGITARIMIEK